MMLPTVQGTPNHTLQALVANPFPSELVAGPTGARVAWVFNAEGKRNIWLAEGPDWAARQITQYKRDDGQELTSLAISADAKWIVFVRGGDHGGNFAGSPPNPDGSITAPKVTICALPVAGGEVKELGEGDAPKIDPTGTRVAYISGGKVMIAPIDGAKHGEPMFFARGTCGDLQWSPDGKSLAFTLDRGRHSFVSVYRQGADSLAYLDPTTARDSKPRWSPDGTKIAFARLPGQTMAPQLLLKQTAQPWSIVVFDQDRGTKQVVWNSPKTLWASFDDSFMDWQGNSRIAFSASFSGWPNLYSVPATGGEPTPLATGKYMVEEAVTAPPGDAVAYAANTGSDRLDIDRRHIFVATSKSAAIPIESDPRTMESSPRITGDKNWLFFMRHDAQNPPWPCVAPIGGGPTRELAPASRVAKFSNLIEPKQVIFRSGRFEIHGQLFEKPGGPAQKPAVIFVHGGPTRQMLLGWHYMDYYAHDYAINQMLAARGFVVLSVNYRLGIGYGWDFQNPLDAGWGTGDGEMSDVEEANRFLRSRPEVDSSRIGIYGGSYGGYLVAAALAKDSAHFAAGVDIHGVHDWSAQMGIKDMATQNLITHQPTDMADYLKIAWKTSPLSSLSSWKSPVLLIQGDDDRNVDFDQLIDLEQRLRERQVDVDTLVLPDETHQIMLHRNFLKTGAAIIEYLNRKLHP